MWEDIFSKRSAKKMQTSVNAIRTPSSGAMGNAKSIQAFLICLIIQKLGLSVSMSSLTHLP